MAHTSTGKAAARSAPRLDGLPPARSSRPAMGRLWALFLGTFLAGCLGRYGTFPEAIGGPVGPTGCTAVPRLSLIELYLTRIYPGDRQDVPLANFDETARAYRARLPHVKSRAAIDALRSHSHFASLDAACQFGDSAEVWRDACPRPDTFLGHKDVYPRPEALADAWLLCDSARELGLVAARR
jgi:hypothetical protein